MSCDTENQTRLFLRNGFIQEGFELAKSATGKFYKSKNLKWVRDPESNRRPEDFSWHDAFYSPKKAITIAWDTEATTDGDMHKRYTSNFYCDEFGNERFETEKQMLNFLKFKGVKDVNIFMPTMQSMMCPAAPKVFCRIS